MHAQHSAGCLLRVVASVFWRTWVAHAQDARRRALVRHHALKPREDLHGAACHSRVVAACHLRVVAVVRVVIIFLGRRRAFAIGGGANVASHHIVIVHVHVQLHVRVNVLVHVRVRVH